MDQPHVTVLSGDIRPLTPEEKKKYPKYKYITTATSKYVCGCYTIEVPEGFLTDGSSGGPDYGRSWLFHDYLYATHAFSSGQLCSRAEADKVMENVLLHEGMTWYCWAFINIAYYNPFWLFSKAWNSSGTRGAEYIIDTISECDETHKPPHFDNLKTYESEK